MATTRNEHTGDLIQSKPSSSAFRDNMDRIIDNKKAADTSAKEAMKNLNRAKKGGDYVR